jgi:hypothetical protein
VVADPPWYIEEMQAFLWVAAYLCRPGGRILLSLPPIGTRPAIEQERARLLKWACTLGLAPIGVESAALPYVSPLFERNALRAQHLQTVPSEWRRGDLGIFERQAALALPRPASQQQPAWIEVNIDGVRFRIRDAGSVTFGFADPALVSLVTGDILPTVSRRDHRRAAADVWTSGNRIYRCHSPRILATVLRSISVDIDPLPAVEAVLSRHLSVVERARVSAAIEHLTSVVATERAEARHLGEP